MDVKKIALLSCCCVFLANLLLANPAGSAVGDKVITPILSLLLGGGGATMEENIPSLSLMVAKDTDKIEMAWIPGSDGKTPVDKVQYGIYLSTTENFTPGPSNLKMTVTGASQTEVTGLAADTLYYAKVVAVYATSSSVPSNSLQTKTYKYPVQQDPSVTVAKADELGLGTHTTIDGSTYTYSSNGTLPTSGSALFSEDTAGGMTLRRVTSASASAGTVTVYTTDASLTDVLDRGSVYSSFQLFDVASEAQALPVSSSKIATAKSMTAKDGSEHTSMEWKNKLLSAEQTNFAYTTKELTVIPQGKSSIIKLVDPKEVTSSFTATVTTKFEPQLITSAEWGGFIVKHLDSAKVAAKGTLSLTALAQYDFAAAGSANKDFQLFKRSWISVYSAGPVPVYQKVTLFMDVKASASASAKIKAMAQARLAEIVEVGARYNGSTWTPYITHGDDDSLTASLDIVGGANGEIRLIPKVEVEFYKVVSSSLTVEPFAKSSLTFAETTNNVSFLAAHPAHLIQLTSFDASLELESNVAVTLSALGHSWDVLPTTCVLGTVGCTYNFSPVDLFSIPQLTLNTTSSSQTQTDLQLQITDGTYNPYTSGSIRWEVFPGDATISPGVCTKAGATTTCAATLTPGAEAEYTVFASGTDKLGEIGRQFKEITVGGGTCSSGPQTVLWKEQEWQRCDDGQDRTWDNAISYCENLVLDGHADWRLPTKDELEGLRVCTTGIYVDPYLPDYSWCNDGSSSPTIDPSFRCAQSYYWSSTTSAYDVNDAWIVYFFTGYVSNTDKSGNDYVRCVRGGQ